MSWSLNDEAYPKYFAFFTQLVMLFCTFLSMKMVTDHVRKETLCLCVSTLLNLYPKLALSSKT